MIPGIIVKDGAAYKEVSGTLYRVLAFRQEPQFGLVPILDIPQMTDERWQELARERRAAGKGVPA